MTEFLLGTDDIGRWLHQNHTIPTGDFVEGCLLDNWVVATKRGFAAIYEHYLNPNSSCYRIVWEDSTAQNMFAQWYKFEEEAENASYFLI
jgi:hypothetical protein